MTSGRSGPLFYLVSFFLWDRDKYTVRGGTRCCVCDHRAEEERGERRGKYRHLWREAPLWVTIWWRC